VAITRGITPWRIIGSTTTRLKPKPRTISETSNVAAKASGNGRPTWLRKNSMMKAGSMTISPSAKLIVPDACQSRVKPRAANA
jgi:hypothetical protein